MEEEVHLGQFRLSTPIEIYQWLLTIKVLFLRPLLGWLVLFHLLDFVGCLPVDWDGLRLAGYFVTDWLLCGLGCFAQLVFLQTLDWLTQQLGRASSKQIAVVIFVLYAIRKGSPQLWSLCNHFPG
ncbi:LOW QUALITY PROTEIN: hypothetical protein NC652_008601 [Populus alba x Populus x berolinensis]|nr:LOW QUALITY PROTEIN: hypothetical protein NC652_008601 [Populus alba x Populus x berolinensis]